MNQINIIQYAAIGLNIWFVQGEQIGQGNKSGTKKLPYLLILLGVQFKSATKGEQTLKSPHRV